MTLSISQHWYASDLGRQREGNEDAVFVKPPLFVVADGMGGAEAGEIASEIAVRAFSRGLPRGPARESLAEVIEQANQRIYKLSRTQRGRAGMGTTVTAAYVDQEEVVFAQVGDSRAYCFRGGELTQITTDHSLVGELVARGKLTEQQAEVHPQRSVITRALGPEEFVEVDIEPFAPQDEDIFLLCSDGLTGMVPEDDIAEILSEAQQLSDAGKRLIDAANDAGGRDNINVALFRVGDGEPMPAAKNKRARSGLGSDDDTVNASDIDPVDSKPSPAQSVSNSNVGDDLPARGNTQSHGRVRRWVFRSVALGVALLVLLLGGWFATRQVYFLGSASDDADAITVYRGLPYELPAGIKLYEPFVSSGVTLRQVPSDRVETFTDHKLRSRKDAESLLWALERGELS